MFKLQRLRIFRVRFLDDKIHMYRYHNYIVERIIMDIRTHYKKILKSRSSGIPLDRLIGCDQGTLITHLSKSMRSIYPDIDQRVWYNFLDNSNSQSQMSKKKTIFSWELSYPVIDNDYNSSKIIKSRKRRLFSYRNILPVVVQHKVTMDMLLTRFQHDIRDSTVFDQQSFR